MPHPLNVTKRNSAYAGVLIFTVVLILSGGFSYYLIGFLGQTSGAAQELNELIIKVLYGMPIIIALICTRIGIRILGSRRPSTNGC